MKQINSFSIMFTFILLLLMPNLTSAMLDSKTEEIPYQIENSDRIVIGTVSDINPGYSNTIYTITVKEWLYNPLPVDTIKVETRTGTNVVVEDEAEFSKNESVLLMLKDANINNRLFDVTFGFPGKHPVSDRDAVIKELKALGKWKGENQIGNKTNDIEPKPRTSVNSSQDTPSKSAILDINDPNLQRVPLPDFGPQTFKNLKNNPDFLATRGQMPQFFTQAERKNWLDKLDNIRELADNDLSPYAYPKGPVLGHGDGENGCIEVYLYKGMNVTDNQIDEIYNVINKLGNKLNIQDVPVVFFKSDFVQDAILTEDSGAIEEKSNLSTSKANNGELSYSNNDSISDNSSVSNGNKSSGKRVSPGFGLLGSLICLYGGWRLTKK